MNSLERSDLLSRSHTARSFLGDIKRRFDLAHSLTLSAKVSEAVERLTECIDAINKEDTNREKSLEERIDDVDVSIRELHRRRQGLPEQGKGGAGLSPLTQNN